MNISERKRIGFYDYTVVLTYIGMLFAFTGVLFAVKCYFCGAILCLMSAGICDMFDGAIASTKKRTEPEKKFGIQIDSLSDLISFGVLPGIMAYEYSGEKLVVGVVAAVYVLAALIRLAYFNVLEEERQSRTTERRKIYLGVPVTSIAILLPAMFLLFEIEVAKGRMICFSFLLVITASGFLTPVQIKKPGKLGKLCIIALGICELVGVVLLTDWGCWF